MTLAWRPWLLASVFNLAPREGRKRAAQLFDSYRTDVGAPSSRWDVPVRENWYHVGRLTQRNYMLIDTSDRRRPSSYKGWQKGPLREVEGRGNKPHEKLVKKDKQQYTDFLQRNVRLTVRTLIFSQYESLFVKSEHFMYPFCMNTYAYETVGNGGSESTVLDLLWSK